MELIDNAFCAMDCALKDPAALTIEMAAQGIVTGLPAPTMEDLERLFRLMASAAARFRLYDGPAPAHWADTWKQAAARCSVVCGKASMEYLSLCIGAGLTIGGAIRERRDSWNYMANLFSIWPARDGSILVEPSSITAEAGIRPVQASTDAEEGKPLYHLNTVLSRQELSRIFYRLATAGYIDGSAPEALANFLNAFDPAAEKQGRIVWIWADKRQSRPSSRHILDFVAQMDGGSLAGITPELYNRTAPAIFGRSFGRDIVSEFVTRWNSGKYCDTHADISAIITGRDRPIFP